MNTTKEQPPKTENKQKEVKEISAQEPSQRRTVAFSEIEKWMIRRDAWRDRDMTKSPGSSLSDIKQ